MQTFRKRRAGLSVTAGLSCFKKAQLTVFLGFYWVLSFIGFSDFLLNEQLGSLLGNVGWFCSSAELLFRFAGSVDYLKICIFVTYWSLEAVNIKKSLLLLVWQSEVELSLVRVFSAGFTQNPVGYLDITRVFEPCCNRCILSIILEILVRLVWIPNETNIIQQLFWATEALMTGSFGQFSQAYL